MALLGCASAAQAQTFTVNGNMAVNQDLSVTQNVTVNQDMTVKRNLTVNGKLILPSSNGALSGSCAVGEISVAVDPSGRTDAPAKVFVCVGRDVWRAVATAAQKTASATDETETIARLRAEVALLRAVVCAGHTASAVCSARGDGR